MTHDDIARIVRAAHLGRTIRQVELEDQNFGSHSHLVPTDTDEQYAYLLGSTDWDIENRVRNDDPRIKKPDWLVLY